MKNIRNFLSEKLSFSVVNCSVYLNRRVFVMNLSSLWNSSTVHRIVPASVAQLDARPTGGRRFDPR